MPARPPADAHLQYVFAYCRECDCHTYLMRWAKGTYKAKRKHGVVLGLKCCRCKKMRAVVGTFVTQGNNGNNQLPH